MSPNKYLKFVYDYAASEIDATHFVYTPLRHARRNIFLSLKGLCFQARAPLEQIPIFAGAGDKPNLQPGTKWQLPGPDIIANTLLFGGTLTRTGCCSFPTAATKNRPVRYLGQSQLKLGTLSRVESNSSSLSAYHPFGTKQHNKAGVVLQ